MSPSNSHAHYEPRHEIEGLNAVGANSHGARTTIFQQRSNRHPGVSNDIELFSYLNKLPVSPEAKGNVMRILASIDASPVPPQTKAQMRNEFYGMVCAISDPHTYDRTSLLKNLCKDGLSEAEARKSIDYLVEKRYEALSSALELAAHPEKNIIGRYGDCTSASTLFVLASESPLEHLRLSEGLITRGDVLLRDGHTLMTIESSVLKNETRIGKTYANRTFAGRILNGSMRELGNGSLTYNSASDESRGAIRDSKGNVLFNGSYTGLFDFQYTNVKSALLGSVYTARYFESPNNAKKAFLDSSIPKGTEVSLNWASNGIHCNHVVNFVGVEKYNGKLVAIIRNPWGSPLSAGRNEKLDGGPGTRVVRPDLGYGFETIDFDEFCDRVRCAVVKDTSSRPMRMLAENDYSLVNFHNAPDFMPIPAGFDYTRPVCSVKQTPVTKSELRKAPVAELNNNLVFAGSNTVEPKPTDERMSVIAAISKLPTGNARTEVGKFENFGDVKSKTKNEDEMGEPDNNTFFGTNYFKTRGPSSKGNPNAPVFRASIPKYEPFPRENS